MSIDDTGQMIRPPPLTGTQQVHYRVLVQAPLTSIDPTVDTDHRPGGLCIGIQITNQLDTAGVLKVIFYY